MLNAIIEHQHIANDCHPTLIVGYAVAVAGTMRSAYLNEAGQTTYNEANACVVTKHEASDLMSRLLDRDPALYQHACLVPCLQMENLRNGLPTTYGY